MFPLSSYLMLSANVLSSTSNMLKFDGSSGVVFVAILTQTECDSSCDLDIVIRLCLYDVLE